MYRIRKLVAGNDLIELQRLFDEGRFVDGSFTVVDPGHSIKSNLQLDQTDPRGGAANQFVHRILSSNDEFKAYAYPLRVSSITFSRYEVGMQYGSHTDAPVNWSKHGAVRSDLSFTIFLSSPDEYDGGELVANVLDDEIKVKYELGDMVVYPSGLQHEVAEVTRGVRKAAVGWVQSSVPESDRREILRALDQVQRDIFAENGRCDRFNSVAYAYSNLVRMWSRV